MGTEITGAALRALRRRLGLHVALVIATAAFLGALGVAWFEISSSGVREGGSDALVVPERVFGSVLAGLVAWSIVSTFHRALVVVLTSPDGPDVPGALTAVRHRVGALISLAVWLGAVDFVSQVGAALVVYAASAALGLRPMALFACGFVVWWATRAAAGTATARAVLAGDSGRGALRASAVGLRGHRLASLVSRMVLALPGLGAAVLLGHGEHATREPWQLACVALLVAVVVALDGAIEATWLARLHVPRFDPHATARVFD